MLVTIGQTLKDPLKDPFLNAGNNWTDDIKGSFKGSFFITYYQISKIYRTSFENYRIKSFGQ
jgi:hypothetical protein